MNLLHSGDNLIKFLLINESFCFVLFYFIFFRICTHRMDRREVEGKIMVCHNMDRDSAMNSGAAGLITTIDPDINRSSYDTFPYITVDQQVFEDIRLYLKSTKYEIHT